MSKSFEITADEILSRLLAARPEPTANAPKDCRGIYGLYDHRCELRYIGATESLKECFYKRIHRRHRTGTGVGHKYSWFYNCGRIWRQQEGPARNADEKIAKRLRNEFIADYCKAVWVPLPDEIEFSGLESEVIDLAPADAKEWNQNKFDVYDEPVELVDKTIARLRFGKTELEAIERQKARYLATRS